MSDELNALETEAVTEGRNHTRTFLVFALLLSVAAIASMVVAVSAPGDHATNYFGRPVDELVGPGPMARASPPQADAPPPRECLPNAHIRLTSPKPIRAVRVCGGTWTTINQPVTVLNSPGKARAFVRLSRALAGPNTNTSCTMNLILAPQIDVSVLIDGRWLAVELPAACHDHTPAVYDALKTLRPPDNDKQFENSLPASPGPWPKGATACAQRHPVRFSLPPVIEALRVCGGYWARIDMPATVLNSPATAHDFRLLSRALAEPSTDMTCLAIAYAVVVVYVSVRVHGQWLGVEPPQTCRGINASVTHAIDALVPAAKNW